MKVLLVTGSSRGIGAQICRQASKAGWAVCVNYAKSHTEATALVTQINQAGGQAIAVQADVADEHQVSAMFEKIKYTLGPVSGLVNCAGANGCGSRVDEMDVALTKRMFEVNTLGAFVCAKYAIRHMAKRYGGNGGAIVNISSAAAKHGGPFTYVDYAASKGALDTMTIGLAKEQADQGIRVNCLRPGVTMTEISTEYAEHHPQWLEWVMSQVPMNRPAEVEEIAQGALFLLSDQASYSTGAILDMSGGWVSP